MVVVGEIEIVVRVVDELEGLVVEDVVVRLVDVRLVDVIVRLVVGDAGVVVVVVILVVDVSLVAFEQCGFGSPHKQFFRPDVGQERQFVSVCSPACS